MRNTLFALALAALVCVPVRAVEVVTGIVDPYLRIQTALSGDTVKGIAEDAAAIATEAGRLGDDGKALQGAATELKAARDLEAARTAFGKLSDALLGYANATKTAMGADVNVAYCPMKQKSWVQKGDKISNPYYGKEMAGCGEFTKK